MQHTKFLVPSLTPLQDIQQVAYEGQDPMKRMYRPGYEDYLGMMPVLEAGDPMLAVKVDLIKAAFAALSADLKDANWVLRENIPAPGNFNRTILALEHPSVDAGGELVEGKELVLARWGVGFTSPVHGHMAGYIHEGLLQGKLRINRYQMTAHDSDVVRPLDTVVVDKYGTFVSLYAQPNAANHFKRQTLIHSFTALEESFSVHYVPEHTRDGRDNNFKVEYFEDTFVYDTEDLRRISGKDGMYLRPGEVIMVRSQNVPEFGDHYVVITGAPEMKEWGLRPQDVAIYSPGTKKVLDKYAPINGLVLLHLQDDARDEFLRFHNITVKGRTVTFPNA